MKSHWLIALCSLMMVANAQSLEDAQGLYAAGKFLEASNMAAALGSSAGYVLAARGLDWYAGDQPTAKQEALYVQCEQYGRKAVELNPRNADAYFELGAAIGRLGGLRGAANAFLNGVAGQVKSNFERALDLNPRQVLALIGLGRWHAEIVSRGVAVLFGGDGNQVKTLFERALLADPKSVAVRLEYAHALLVLDEKANRVQARALLEAARELTSRDFAERRQWLAVQRLLAKLP